MQFSYLNHASLKSILQKERCSTLASVIHFGHVFKKVVQKQQQSHAVHFDL